MLVYDMNEFKLIVEAQVRKLRTKPLSLESAREESRSSHIFLPRNLMSQEKNPDPRKK